MVLLQQFVLFLFLGKMKKTSAAPIKIAMIARQNCDLCRCIDFSLPLVAFPLEFALLKPLDPINPAHA